MLLHVYTNHLKFVVDRQTTSLLSVAKRSNRRVAVHTSVGGRHTVDTSLGGGTRNFRIGSEYFGGLGPRENDCTEETELPGVVPAPPSPPRPEQLERLQESILFLAPRDCSHRAAHSPIFVLTTRTLTEAQLVVCPLRHLSESDEGCSSPKHLSIGRAPVHTRGHLRRVWIWVDIKYRNGRVACQTIFSE